MKYICTVCGWEYDESAGCPERGKRTLPYETRLLLSLTNAVGAGRMRQAAREKFGEKNPEMQVLNEKAEGDE